MDTLNNRLVRAIIQKDRKSFLALCSDDLKGVKDLNKGMQTLFEQVGSMAKGNPFVVRHHYYASFPEKGTVAVIHSGQDKEHAFDISYTSRTRKSFAIVGIIADSFQEIAVMTVWGNYGGKWKLNVGQSGLIRAFNKDAVDWYYRARQQYGDHALVDAANSMTICQALLHPGGDYWKYRLDDDMTGLIMQIRNTAERDYTFPIELSAVATKPKIISTATRVFTDGYYPVVAYVTKLSFADTAALSKECDSLNAHIGDIFNNLDHYNKLLIYRPYERMPQDSSDQVTTYTIVKKSTATWFY